LSYRANRREKSATKLWSLAFGLIRPEERVMAIAAAMQEVEARERLYAAVAKAMTR